MQIDVNLYIRPKNWLLLLDLNLYYIQPPHWLLNKKKKLKNVYGELQLKLTMLVTLNRAYGLKRQYSVYKFPKDIEKRKSWIKAIPSSNLIVENITENQGVSKRSSKIG